MCGDGANDLLALREADLSFGIQQCDASYGCSFTISNLLDVDEVIRESKNNVSNFMHILLYTFSTFIIAKVILIIFISNGSNHSLNVRYYYNFTSLLLYCLVLPLSNPSPKPTPYTPNSSIITLYGHLVIWGNVFLSTITMIICFIFYQTTEDFHDNTPI